MKLTHPPSTIPFITNYKKTIKCIDRYIKMMLARLATYMINFFEQIPPPTHSRWMRESFPMWYCILTVRSFPSCQNTMISVSGCSRSH